MRARWSHGLRGTPLLNTAFAWEAVLDEVVFIVGPVLATFLATASIPLWAWLAAACSGCSGPSPWPPSADYHPWPPQRTSQPPRGSSARLLAPIVFACAALGILFVAWRS